MEGVDPPSIPPYEGGKSAEKSPFSRGIEGDLQSFDPQQIPFQIPSEKLLNSPDSLSQIWDLPPAEVLALAEKLVYTRSLTPYPGWYFNIEWESVDSKTRLRKAIWEYFRKKQLADRIIVRWYHELQIILYLGTDFSSQQFIAGCYEPNEFYYLNQILRPGMTFLDVGANEGIYALFAAQCVGGNGTVLAFEPSQREFNILQENIALNHFSNIKPFKLALSNSEGNTTLKIANYEHSGQNTFGEFVHDVVSCEQVETVPVKRLDDLLEATDRTPVDVIKIDIEGAEFSVLQGAQATLEKYHPLLLLEVFDEALQKQGSSAVELIAFLRSHGYEIFTFGRFVGVPVRFEGDRPLSSSCNIIAAHPSHTWSGLSQAEQSPLLHQELEGTRQALENAEATLKGTQTALHDTDLQLRRLQYKYELTQQELTVEIHQLKQQVLEANHQQEQTQAALEHAHDVITAMSSSKFWQLRNVWDSLKQAVGFKK